MTAFLLAGDIGVKLNEIFANFDYSAFEFMGNLQSDTLTFIAKMFTSMGAVMYTILFAVMGLILCFFKRTRKVGFALVFAVIIGTVITNVAVKPLVARIRPYNILQGDPAYWSWYVGAGMLSESDFSFPSGHTTGAVEIAVALMLCHAGSKKKGAKAVCWIFPLLALGTAASRVYLMVHYATDVIAAIIIGIFAGVVGYNLSRLVCKLFKNKDRSGVRTSRATKAVGVIAIAVGWMLIYTVALNATLSNGGEDALRCAYNEEYDCQNEAKTSDKYPAIDGERYCKIHWKQLMGE